jgi:predicted ATPase
VEAEACFGKAIEVARSQQAKSWELRTTTSLAELLSEQGRREEARQRLTQILGRFTEGSDGWDYTRAKSLLDALS